MRGEEPPPRRDVNVDLGVSVYLPRSYIPADRQRMEVYRRVVRCSTEEELTQLQADLVDVYGKMPHAMETLLAEAEVRILAGALGISSVVLMKPDIIFSIRDWQQAEHAFEGAAGSVRLPDDRTAYWRPPASYLELPTLLAVLRKQLKRGREKVR